jgi:hypothetical protein
MSRKRASLTLSIDAKARENLEAIALALGITWGEEKPNVSRMIEMIGKGELTVTKDPNHKLRIDQSLVMAEKSLEAALEAIKQAKA